MIFLAIAWAILLILGALAAANGALIVSAVSFIGALIMAIMMLRNVSPK